MKKMILTLIIMAGFFLTANAQTGVNRNPNPQNRVRMERKLHRLELRRIHRMERRRHHRRRILAIELYPGIMQKNRVLN